jgi:hypothetical protein
MPSLDSLPAEIIMEIAQYLDIPPRDYSPRERRFYAKNDLLALASASRQAREILFDKTWVKRHVMRFGFREVARTVRIMSLSRRSRVEYVSFIGSEQLIGG